jgi:hypothetical protein
MSSWQQNKHDGPTFKEENIVHGPYYVEHPWFGFRFLTTFTTEKYTARAIPEYMNHWHIAATSPTRSQHPRIEGVLGQCIVTTINWVRLVREACVEPGVLRESKTFLIGAVAEVPKNVV